MVNPGTFVPFPAVERPHASAFSAHFSPKSGCTDVVPPTILTGCYFPASRWNSVCLFVPAVVTQLCVKVYITTAETTECGLCEDASLLLQPCRRGNALRGHTFCANRKWGKNGKGARPLSTPYPRGVLPTPSNAPKKCSRDPLSSRKRSCPKRRPTGEPTRSLFRRAGTAFVCSSLLW